MYAHLRTIFAESVRIFNQTFSCQISVTQIDVFLTVFLPFTRISGLSLLKIVAGFYRMLPPPTREKGRLVPHGWIFPLKRKQLWAPWQASVLKKEPNEAALFTTQALRTNRVSTSGSSVEYSYCYLSILAKFYLERNTFVLEIGVLPTYLRRTGRKTQLCKRPGEMPIHFCSRVASKV